MKVLGITGGVGAGKSTVLTYLQERYHARVLQADRAAHLLEQPGESCYDAIVDCFGREILQADKTIDRKRLGEIVFGDPKRMEQLNEIVHPKVKEYIGREVEKERQKNQIPFFVIEAALLLEDHYQTICDEIWYIHTDADVRMQRLKDSRGYSEEKTKRMMKNQLDEAQFLKQCQFVVDNSSNIVENTYEQIDRGLVEHEFL